MKAANVPVGPSLACLFDFVLFPSYYLWLFFVSRDISPLQFLGKKSELQYVIREQL